MLKRLLLGPCKRRVTFEKFNLLSRIGVSKHYAPIARVEITTNSITAKESYLFPWVKNKEEQYWYLQTKVRTSDGRSFKHSVTSQADLKLAIEFAYMSAISNVMSLIHRIKVPNSQLGA